MQDEPIVGQSTVEEQIAAAEGESELLFGGGATPEASFELPEGMTAEEFAEAKAKFIAEHGGPQSIDEMSDDAAASLAGQVQIPMQQLVLAGAPLKIVPGEEGEKAIVIGPIAMHFVIPLSAEGARAVAADLNGGIQVAKLSDIPKLEIAR